MVSSSFYVGYWFVTKGVSIELHKFWFCHDDLMHCVGRTSRKYAFNRLALPSLCLVLEGTNLIQIEVVALKEYGFLLLEKLRCPFVNSIGDNISALVKQPPECTPWNLFGDGTFTHVYKPLYLNVWPKSRNGKKICRLNTFKLSIL
jgi:hypothetical protein